MEAILWKEKPNNQVECILCGHRCQISEGKRGACGVRENRKGRLYSLVYGQAISVAIDPIEKKPLFHFLPGSISLSVATVGCNLHCLHCQNHSISQMPYESGRIEGSWIEPKQIIDIAVKKECQSISYTYTEPTVFFEYAQDIGLLAKEKGIKNVFVTNGLLSKEAIDKASSWLDGANVDLKSFRSSWYKQVCKGPIQAVLESIPRMKERGIWIEVTTLIIPDGNDSDEELKEIAKFIRDIDKGIPWHITRFHPCYKMLDRPVTPISTLHRAREIGLNMGLKYVYIGNIWGDKGEHTYCPKCGHRIITRYGFNLEEINIKDKKCKFCNEPIDGVGIP